MVAGSLVSTRLIFSARVTVVLPTKGPELRCNRPVHPFVSRFLMHRTLRQPHLLGSGVSFTHASSRRIFSIEAALDHCGGLRTVILGVPRVMYFTASEDSGSPKIIVLNLSFSSGCRRTAGVRTNQVCNQGLPHAYASGGRSNS